MKTYHGHVYKDIRDKFQHLEEFGDVDHHEHEDDDHAAQNYTIHNLERGLA